MSKIVAFIFGAFIIITLLVFIVMLTIHISRVIFARDSIMSVGELMQLALWWQQYVTKKEENKSTISSLIEKNKNKGINVSKWRLSHGISV